MHQYHAGPCRKRMVHPKATLLDLPRSAPPAQLCKLARVKAKRLDVARAAGCRSPSIIRGLGPLRPDRPLQKGAIRSQYSGRRIDSRIEMENRAGYAGACAGLFDP